MKSGTVEVGITALVTALSLFVLTAIWVSVPLDLRKADYFIVDLYNGIQPRALTGTIVHTFNLSSNGFIGLLQLFKLGWLILLCFQIFSYIKNSYIAVLLCTMFAFNNPVYINDHIPGFVDVAMNFWLLLSTIMIVKCTRRSQRATIIWLLISQVPLFLALLTHEIAIFPSIVLMAWLFWYYRRTALFAFIPWLLLTAMYFAVIWQKHVSGLSPEAYISQHIYYFNKDRILNSHLSIMGIFTAVGMLWVVYAILAWRAIHQQMQPAIRQYLYCLLIGGGIGKSGNHTLWVRYKSLS